MSARVTSPEAKRIATSFAYCTTWLLVTTWPPLSQTNPVPDATPPSVSSPSGLAVDCAATTCTTEGDTFSKISILARSASESGPRCSTARAFGPGQAAPPGLRGVTHQHTPGPP